MRLLLGSAFIALCLLLGGSRADAACQWLGGFERDTTTQYLCTVITTPPLPPTLLQSTNGCTVAPCTTATTAATTTLPDTVVPGNLLIAIFTAPTGTISAVTTPTGWTLNQSSASIGGLAYQIYLYIRTAQGTSNDAATVTWTGSSAIWQLWEGEFAYATVSSPIYGWSAIAYTSTSNGPPITGIPYSTLIVLNNHNSSASCGGFGFFGFSAIAGTDPQSLNIFGRSIVDTNIYSCFNPYLSAGTNYWSIIFGIKHS